MRIASPNDNTFRRINGIEIISDVKKHREESVKQIGNIPNENRFGNVSTTSLTEFTKDIKHITASGSERQSFANPSI
ncbi:hypothetical protein [Paenibacillus sp. L3-i20]|uniref:hypothetical protein n=1 Tax=Paenibacillus sp. L3-i20 TaxID=2905833 RepID=UPI0020C0D23F|nr:hypothetical protein [Paenibacillus sp. L3-i20]